MLKKPLGLNSHHRVVNLRRRTYTTTRAAAALLKAARDEGIPDCISETTQHRYRRALCERETPYGPLVQDVSLPNADIAIQHPLAMLHMYIHYSYLAIGRLFKDSPVDASLRTNRSKVWHFATH